MKIIVDAGNGGGGFFATKVLLVRAVDTAFAAEAAATTEAVSEAAAITEALAEEVVQV